MEHANIFQNPQPMPEASYQQYAARPPYYQRAPKNSPSGFNMSSHKGFQQQSSHNVGSQELTLFDMMKIMVSSHDESIKELKNTTKI